MPYNLIGHIIILWQLLSHFFLFFLFALADVAKLAVADLIAKDLANVVAIIVWLILL